MSLAENYQQVMVPAIMDRRAEDLAKIVSPGDQVIDLACGTGVVSRYPAAEAKSMSSPPGAPIDWCECDAPSMPCDGSSCGVALCQFALMFFPDRRAALREIRRVLKPKGKLALSVMSDCFTGGTASRNDPRWRQFREL